MRTLLINLLAMKSLALPHFFLGKEQSGCCCFLSLASCRGNIPPCISETQSPTFSMGGEEFLNRYGVNTVYRDKDSRRALMPQLL